MAATLLKTKCPNCGAPIRIDTNAEHVTCEFCQHSSLLAKRGQQPKRNAQTMHFGTINVDAAQRARRVLLFVILGTSLLPVIGIGTCVAVMVGGARTMTSSFNKSGVKATLDKAFGKTTGQTKKEPPGTKLRAANLSRVLGAELLQQALVVARKVDAHAKLRWFRLPRVTKGKVDVARGDRAYFSFGYDFRDPKKPPGEDISRGHLDVSLRRGAFHVKHFIVSSPSTYLADPGCSLEAMWAAAVKSGVPANAVARAFYKRGEEATSRLDYR